MYVVSRDGKSLRLVTRGAFDVSKVLGVDEKGGWLYYIASPGPAGAALSVPHPASTARARPSGSRPGNESGTHAYDLAPNFRYALETYSSFGKPPVIRLVRLPGHEVVRTLVDNARLRNRVAALRKGRSSSSLSRRRTASRMPAYLMKPADFDSTQKYPLLFHVYGGPGNSTVNDAWGGYYLWHLMLTQRGYLVASVDNRGTPAPLGRRWRKSIYGQLGVVETRDQATAARTLAQRPYVDRRPRSASGAGATAAS